MTLHLEIILIVLSVHFMSDHFLGSQFISDSEIWFDQNCMQANAEKFQVGLLSRDPQITSIILNINYVVLKSTAWSNY